MMRAMSTRKIRSGYEKLEDQEVKLIGSSSGKSPEMKKAAEKPGSSVHPLMSFFNVGLEKKTKKKKKKSKTTTAKPEYARYLEYVKEGGVWDSTSNGPVIYYR